MTVLDFLKAADKKAKREKTEKEISAEDAFVAYSLARKCKPLKLVILGKRGFPDRTVLCPGGRVMFIEFKRKGKKLAGNQSLIKLTLERLGFTYCMCDTLDEAKEALDKFLSSP